MSNAKKIRIEGDLNTAGLLVAAGYKAENKDLAIAEAVEYSNIFMENANDALKAAKVLQAFMAQTVTPTFGLTLTFTGESRNANNTVDGLVIYYQYVLEGVEAVSYEYVDALVASLGQWGRVYADDANDV